MHALIGMSLTLQLKLWLLIALGLVVVWQVTSFCLMRRRDNLIERLGRQLGPYYGRAAESLRKRGERDVAGLTRQGMHNAVEELVGEMPRGTWWERYRVERTRREMEMFTRALESLPRVLADMESRGPVSKGATP